MKIKSAILLNGSHQIMDAEEDAPLLTIKYHNEVAYNLNESQRQEVLMIAWDKAAELMGWEKH